MPKIYVILDIILTLGYYIDTYMKLLINVITISSMIKHVYNLLVLDILCLSA